MEEEEEAHTVLDEATAITLDEVEAEDTSIMAREVLIIDNCAALSLPACFTMVRSWQQTKQYHYRRNSCNMLAQVTYKT